MSWITKHIALNIEEIIAEYQDLQGYVSSKQTN